MSSARIFLVEDESIIAMAIEQSLEFAGYRVCGLASSGEKALDLIPTTRPDLVLMDIMLAGQLDGVATGKQIRDTLGLPVVYLTALTDQPTLERVKSSEPFGYIAKPCDDQELITAIEIALARHRAETAIRCALKRERELREVKSQFISILSHEFRNPLSTILMTQELLRTGRHELSEEKFERYCNRIAAAVEEMNQLIHEVLTIGETEAKDFECHPTPVDAIAFCQSLLDDFQEKTSIHTLTLSTQNIPASVDLDGKLLHHMLSNLISNAIKYSPKGGAIALDLSCDEACVYFKVEDEGIGIPRETQHRLFEPFHRGSNVGGITGTGLGLAIVKQCVDLHGGTIAVISEVGEGSTFIVSLPLQFQDHGL